MTELRLHSVPETHCQLHKNTRANAYKVIARYRYIYYPHVADEESEV